MSNTVGREIVVCGMMDDTAARGKRRSAYRYGVSEVYLPTLVVTILALSL